jgi:hypothetical protein
MLKDSEDAVTTSNASTVAALQAASGSGDSSTPLTSKQPLPSFVQVTMNDYMDDDDLPATVSYTVFLYVSLWREPYGST